MIPTSFTSQMLLNGGPLVTFTDMANQLRAHPEIRCDLHSRFTGSCSFSDAGITLFLGVPKCHPASYVEQGIISGLGFDVKVRSNECQEFKTVRHVPDLKSVPARPLWPEMLGCDVPVSEPSLDHFQNRLHCVCDGDVNGDGGPRSSTVFDQPDIAFPVGEPSKVSGEFFGIHCRSSYNKHGTKSNRNIV